MGFELPHIRGRGPNLGLTLSLSPETTVPLNRPALVLGTGSRSVPDARKWTAQVMRDLGRDDLVESTELGVTELVTNALLHAQTPIEVRVRGTREHPRVEVSDASPVPPELPAKATFDAQQQEELLLTFGRGLHLVARASEAWGADIELDGKVVWFVPAREFNDGEGIAGTITGLPDPEPAGDSEDLIEIELLRVPVWNYIGFQRHYREVRREVRLLSLANAQEYPLAKRLSEVFDKLERPLRSQLRDDRVVAARAEGTQHIDIRVHMTRTDASGIEQLIELLDLADEFCRTQRLLSLARSPEQVSFQNWFLCEFVRQSNGQPAQAWPSEQPPRVRQTSAS